METLQTTKLPNVENTAIRFVEAPPLVEFCVKKPFVKAKGGEEVHSANTSNPADSKGVFAMAMSSMGGKVLFAAVADEESFRATYNYFTKSLSLLAEAVNNRTRERNYFKKYTELLLGEISEEEFDQEIENNESLYVVQPHIDATLSDISLAALLVENADIMDIDSIDDIADIFSFKYQSVARELKLL